jgi:hypothetical protein
VRDLQNEFTDGTFQMLIAVMSCQRDLALGYHEVIRQSWGKALADIADVRFFVGGPDRLSPDEVWLDAPDDYDHLSLKAIEIFKWAQRCDYEHIFKCDCDTTIFVNRFKRYNYKRIDYAGRFWGGEPGERGLYAAGTGYFLSRKAYEIIITDGHGPVKDEDVMVGNTLEPLIVSGAIKAEHIAESVYGATKGPGEGAPHGAAPEWVLIRREDGMVVPRLKSLIISSDFVVGEP